MNNNPEQKQSLKHTSTLLYCFIVHLFSLYFFFLIPEGKKSDTLQNVTLPVVNRTECQRPLRHRISTNMLCAGGLEAQDACVVSLLPRLLHFPRNNTLNFLPSKKSTMMDRCLFFSSSFSFNCEKSIRSPMFNYSIGLFLVSVEISGRFWWSVYGEISIGAFACRHCIVWKKMRFSQCVRCLHASWPIHAVHLRENEKFCMQTRRSIDERLQRSG